MRISAVVFGVLLAVGCAETEMSPTADAGGRVSLTCTDQDGDGYGRGCDPGGDCDDGDPSIHRGCAACERPSEGCPCDSSNQPVSCFLDPSIGDDGTLMCHEGTRYCRGGTWSGCESIFSYPKPDDSNGQALVTGDGGTETCNDCRPNCFVVRDNLNPTDGGLSGSGSQTQIGDGGGLTIGTYIEDAGVVDSGTYDAAGCIPGSAPDEDCDGILDDYDPYPSDKPFATSNPAIFLDIPAGATATGSIDLTFSLNSVDVYFLVDQTTTMGGERNNLVAGLTTGNFVNDPSYDCSDHDFDHAPNNELKDLGIIGAIRCYIRDANFGAGFFRELPFSAYADTTDTAFRNLQDITSDVDSVLAAVTKLTPRANNDFPEVAIPALHSLVTGDGMYFGTDRQSVPVRGNCPAGTWGYPCFRDGAIPIVVLFTDALSHNGAGPRSESYSASNLTISSANTDQRVTTVDGNEAFASAYDAGDVTSKYVSYAGDTTAMAADASASDFSCTTGTSADAFFKFTLTSAKNVTISTRGSDFDTVLGIWSGAGDPASVTALPSYPNTNDVAGSAYSFGDIAGKYVQASGSTSGLQSDYLAADLGCDAYSGSPDAAFTFTLSETKQVALDTSGSTIGTSLSLFSGTPIAASYTAITNTNDKFASAYDAGAVNGLLRTYSGTTDNGASIVADYAGATLGCSSADRPADNANDVVYSFSVSGSSSRRIRVSAEDSTLDTVLALTDSAGSALPGGGTYTNNEAHDQNPADLGAMDNKAYSISGSTSSLNDDYNSTTVGCGASSNSRDAVFRFTLSSTKNVQLDLASTAFDTVLSLFRTSISSSNRVACSSPSGTYGASITANSLTAGTYWVVVKGTANSGRGAYTLGIRDTAVSLANVLACDYGSGFGGTSAIETDLSPGTYRVIVKGKGSGAKGSYKLQLRDVTALPLGSGRLSCDHNSSSSSKSYLESTLAAGTYTVLLKGDSSSASGDYKLSVRDASSVSAPLSCDDNSGGNNTSLITRSLGAGTYYAAVRGKSSTNTGAYQIHFGGGSTSSSTFVPKNYTETVAALNARDVRVIPILSCHDDTSYSGAVANDCPDARTQYTTLATATDTLDSSLSPLVFDIHSDGSGLSDAVVDSVLALSDYLEMDVSVRVVFEPDANPGFGLSVQAVSQSGDGCAGVVDNEHQDCRPGATPRFEISFTNPAEAPVPTNDADPKGGYNFRAELIGDEQFIVDQVPIYIIPENVTNVPPPPKVYASGTYAQNLSGDGCTGATQLPDWNELSWSATVPDGTTVSFGACSGASSTELESCTAVPLCTIAGGGPCSASSPCPTGSFCSLDGNCHRITGGACTTDDQCSAQATCMAGTCVFSGQPIDVGELLGSQNYAPNLKVTIGMTANTTSNVGPTVHDWSLTYLCKSSL